MSARHKPVPRVERSRVICDVCGEAVIGARTTFGDGHWIAGVHESDWRAGRFRIALSHVGAYR